MHVSRRSVLRQGAACAGAALLAAPAGVAGEQLMKSSGPQRTRFGVSTYSYWHFQGEKYPIEKVIENAATGL